MFHQLLPSSLWVWFCISKGRRLHGVTFELLWFSSIYCHIESMHTRNSPRSKAHQRAEIPVSHGPGSCLFLWPCMEMGPLRWRPGSPHVYHGPTGLPPSSFPLTLNFTCSSVPDTTDYHTRVMMGADPLQWQSSRGTPPLINYCHHDVRYEHPWSSEKLKNGKFN
jgi:hypothetical protein